MASADEYVAFEERVQRTVYMDNLPPQVTVVVLKAPLDRFMVYGMPRPVRARAAEVEMFDDHPKKPGRQITFQWLDPKDPDFEVARKIKDLTRKHVAEAELLLNHQLREEENLAVGDLESQL